MRPATSLASMSPPAVRALTRASPPDADGAVAAVVTSTSPATAPTSDVAAAGVEHGGAATDLKLTSPPAVLASTCPR